jgi:hypothetical protein
MFEGAELNDAMGVPFLYGVCEMIFVGIYCVCGWKAGWTKAPKDAPIWTVLFTTYEVLEAEMKELIEVEVSISDSSSDGSPQKIPDLWDNGVLFHYYCWAESPVTPSSPSSPKIPSGRVPILPIESPSPPTDTKRDLSDAYA